MKKHLLVLVAILAGLSLTGCVFMNDEDKEFYGKGWVHPSELDDIAPKHDPMAAAATNTPATTTTNARPQQSAPEWIVPETTDNNMSHTE